jgi:hypothetical protein
MARDEVFATITRMSVEWQNWGEILQVNTRTIIFPPPT